MQIDNSEKRDRQAENTRPATEIGRTERTQMLCAHVTAYVRARARKCVVIYTYTTTRATGHVISSCEVSMAKGCAGNVPIPQHKKSKVKSSLSTP
jgi:hypothetical protein